MNKFFPPQKAKNIDLWKNKYRHVIKLLPFQKVKT